MTPREEFEMGLSALAIGLAWKILDKGMVLYDKLTQDQRDVLTFAGKHPEDLPRAMLSVVANSRLVRKEAEYDEYLKNHIRFLHSINRLPHVKESNHGQANHHQQGTDV